jgi:hypothetical protein
MANHAEHGARLLQVLPRLVYGLTDVVVEPLVELLEGVVQPAADDPPHRLGRLLVALDPVCAGGIRAVGAIVARQELARHARRQRRARGRRRRARQHPPVTGGTGKRALSAPARPVRGDRRRHSFTSHLPQSPHPRMVRSEIGERPVNGPGSPRGDTRDH